MRRRGALACGNLPAPPMKPLTADDFRASRQRGVGFGSFGSGKRSEADQESLLGLGAGHVRMFIEAERVGQTEAYRIADKQLWALDAAAASLERRGVYLVLVASFGADARADLWRSSRLQASAVAIWRQLAERLRGRAVVAGFDIVNEPVPPGLTYAMRQDRWLDLAARIIEAVQAVDPRRVLIIESAPDATGPSFENLRPLPFQGLVYSLHSYGPFEFTHQAVMAEFTQARRYPEIGSDGRSSELLLAETLEPAARFTRRYDVPVYVGEFSAPRWAPDGSAARYIADSIASFNRHGWSWCYHEYRAWHGWDPEMASPRQDVQQRSSDAPVLRVLRAGLRAARN